MLGAHVSHPDGLLLVYGIQARSLAGVVLCLISCANQFIGPRRCVNLTAALDHCDASELGSGYVVYRGLCDAVEGVL